MLDSENAENIQNGGVNPAPQGTEPAAPVSTDSEAAPATPVAENAKHDKVTAAFIKQRQERKADKQRIAALEARLAAAQPAQAPVPQAPAQTQQNQTVSAPAQPQVTQAESAGVVVSEDAALQAMAVDKDVASVPGAIMDLMDIVDTDPKIARLNAIDPMLAYAEAKKVWLQKTGIAPAPKPPVATKISGGMSVAKDDLGALFEILDTAKPGTKLYRETVAKVNAAMGRR